MGHLLVGDSIQRSVVPGTRQSRLFSGEPADESAAGAKINGKGIFASDGFILELLGVGAAAGVADEHSFVAALVEERERDIDCSLFITVEHGQKPDVAVAASVDGELSN